ncbi:TPA: hypothetical protein ACQZLN_001003 [Klebsiella pneumoniae]|nr:hypothetical protein [Klebsiella pneumoniae]
MTKTAITRERLQEIAEDGFLKHGESKELARMALAAMDGDPVAAVPEDVRQALSKMDDEIIAELDAEESAIRAAMLQAKSLTTINPAPALVSLPKNAKSLTGNSREQSPVVHAYHPDCGCVVCKVATSSNSSDSKTISELTFVIGFDAGKEPPIHAHMEAFGGKVVAVAFRNVLEEHDNDDAASKILDITLPDISSKAFWSGSGKDEVFHPETYRRWVKEAIERYCTIARIDVEVK